MAKSSAYRVTFVVATVVLPIIFVAILGLNALSNQPELGVFLKTMKEASDAFRTNITPAGWAFSIWSVIYTWQGALMAYLVANLVRRAPGSSAGVRFFEQPGLVSLVALLLYSSSYPLTTAWLFLFDRAVVHRWLIVLAAAVLWLTVAVLAASLVLLHRRLAQMEGYLRSVGARADLWAVRVVALNGVAIYAAWCSVAAPLNTAMALAHYAGVAVEDAGTVALAVLGFNMAVYATADAVLLDRWTRYTVTPHLTLVWALGASLAKNYQPGSRNTIFTVVLLALALAATVAKMVLMMVQHFRGPKEGEAAITDLNTDTASVSSCSTVNMKKPIV